jgi:hypothetical protein
MLGHRAFHSFCFSVHSVNRLKVNVNLSVSLSFFLVAHGAFLKISFPGWAGTLFGWLWSAGGYEWPANVCDCCVGYHPI